jgi:hypothetical protein
VYAANDWYTTNLQTGGSAYASNNVDPNSGAILSNYTKAVTSAYATLWFNGTDTTTATNALINRATNSTPTYQISTSVFVNDPYDDDPSQSIPQLSTYIHNDGTSHELVLDTDTCVSYDSYKASFKGTTVTTSSTEVHNLNHPFNEQYSSDGAVNTKGGLPLLGMLDVGEDATAASINHIAYLLVSGSDSPGSSYGVGGHVAPATAGTSCASQAGSNCAYALPFGARMRLRSSFTCPNAGTNPQANKICVQLQTYGAIVADHAGLGQHTHIQLARRADGTNPWVQSDVQVLDNMTMNDFEVMTLGPITSP